MTDLMRAKGAALIRAVEAGARTGMTGMMWGGREIQRLLEETGRLPDVLYMAVVDQNGIIVADSDPSKSANRFAGAANSSIWGRTLWRTGKSSIGGITGRCSRSIAISAPCGRTTTRCGA